MGARKETDHILDNNNKNTENKRVIDEIYKIHEIRYNTKTDKQTIDIDNEKNNKSDDENVNKIRIIKKLISEEKPSVHKSNDYLDQLNKLNILTKPLEDKQFNIKEYNPANDDNNNDVDQIIKISQKVNATDNPAK